MLGLTSFLQPGCQLSDSATEINHVLRAQTNAPYAWHCHSDSVRVGRRDTLLIRLGLQIMCSELGLHNRSLKTQYYTDFMLSVFNNVVNKNSKA